MGLIRVLGLLLLFAYMSKGDDCGPPPTVENGAIEDADARPRVHYVCDDGYVHSGTRQKNRCKRDGTWTDNVKCLPDVGCEGLPARLANAYIADLDEQDGKHPVGTVARHRCLTGYHATNYRYATVKCELQSDGGYSWTRGELDCRGVTCGPLSAPLNGKIDSLVFSFGSRIVFSCNKGYKLEGRYYYTKCQANRQWSNTPPTCRIKCCEAPTAPEGTLLLNQRGICYGDKVTVKCQKASYIMKTSNGEGVRELDIECTEDQTWLEPPPCKEAFCDPVNITYGYSYPKGPIKIGSLINYRCNNDATMDPTSAHNQAAECLPLGKWDRPVPICNKDCPLFDLENGHASRPRWSSQRSRFYHGDRLEVTCVNDNNEKFTLADPNHKDLVCRNGTWSIRDQYELYPPAINTTCLPDPCSIDTWTGSVYRKEGDIVNRRIKLQHSETVMVSCDYGYEGLPDGTTLMCDRGFMRYNGEKNDGKCRLKTCDTSILKTTRLRYHRTLSHGDQADVKCIGGYSWKPNVSERKIRCDDGQVKPLYELCTPSNCTVGLVPSGQVYYLGSEKLSRGNDIPHNVTVRIMCDTGYQVPDWSDISEGTETCTGFSLTGSNDLRCQRKICDLRILKTVQLTNPRTLYHGDQADVECIGGYSWNSQEREIRCDDGQVKPLYELCTPSNCTVEHNLRGHVYYLGTEKLSVDYVVPHNVTVHIMCDTGYQVSETSEISEDTEICKGNSLTGSNDLQCKGKACETVSFSHGILFRNLIGYEKVKTMYHNQSAFIRCNQGYSINGFSHQKLSCVNGDIKPPPVDCIESGDTDSTASCQLDGYIGTTFDSSGNVITTAQNGEKVNPQCDPEYSKIIEEVQCNNGVLNPSPPFCQYGEPETSCQLDGYNGTAFKLGNTRDVSNAEDGTSVYAVCGQHYNLITGKEGWIKCTNGMLDPRPPFCQYTSCRLDGYVGTLFQDEDESWKMVTIIRHDHYVFQSCADQYVSINRRNNWIRCHRGSLSPSPPFCQYTSCQLNGYNGTTFENNQRETVTTLTTGTYGYPICAEHYSRIQDSVRCNYGTLIPSPPFCQFSTCRLGNVPHGYVINNEAGKIMRGGEIIKKDDRLFVKCEDGEARTGEYITCTESPLSIPDLGCGNGKEFKTTTSSTTVPDEEIEMSSVSASVSRISCAPRSTTRAYFNEKENVEEGQTIQFFCPRGYVYPNNDYGNQIDGYTQCKAGQAGQAGQWDPSPECDLKCSMVEDTSFKRASKLSADWLILNTEDCKVACIGRNDCSLVFVESTSGSTTYCLLYGSCDASESSNKECVDVVPNAFRRIYVKGKCSS